MAKCQAKPGQALRRRIANNPANPKPARRNVEGSGTVVRESVPKTGPEAAGLPATTISSVMLNGDARPLLTFTFVVEAEKVGTARETCGRLLISEVEVILVSEKF
jgi:hypothetical protein